MGGRGGTLRLFVTMCRIASNALNWVFKELLLGVPSAIQQVTDAIKQRTFTREIIRRIVSRNGLYSERENHSRLIPDTCDNKFFIPVFSIDLSLNFR